MSDPKIPNIIDGSLGPESANGTLVIIVCRAKHLPNRRKLDKQSPYVTLRIGTTAKKTPSHFRAGQTPEWTHEIRFELTRDRKPIMKLDVLDETKNDPTPIGTVDIDCSTVFANPNNEKDGKYIFDKWHDLTLNGRRAGMIYLEMTFYPSAPILPPKFTDPLYNEQEVDSYHHSLSTKDLPPPPPRHPSQTHPHTVADDIFVTSESEKGLKRLSFFKNSDGLLGGRFSGSNGSGNDDVFESPKDSNNSPPKKYKLKIMNKFKKLQNKEPITNIWQKGNGQGSPERELSPVSDYVVDFNENANNTKKSEYYTLPEMPDKFKESDDEDFELRAPIPPPHLVNHQQNNSERLPPTPPTSKKQPSKSATRKPPQDLTEQTNLRPVSNTSIPFSADTIGLDEGEENNHGALPTKVYFLDQQVKSLTFTGRDDDLKGHQMNPDEIDPKYYAPTPNEHFGKTAQLRFAANEQNGYLGDGKWNRDPKFSPSVFDRMPMVGDENFGFENKPHVPPKIPQGLTEQEYYVLEKEKYLKDINGRRL